MSQLSEAYRKGESFTFEMLYDCFPQQMLYSDAQEIANIQFKRFLKLLYVGKGKYRYDASRNKFVSNHNSEEQ